jgi:hypothetical protein
MPLDLQAELIASLSFSYIQVLHGTLGCGCSTFHELSRALLVSRFRIGDLPDEVTLFCNRAAFASAFAKEAFLHIPLAKIE